jgi:L-aspartate oxidase
MRNFLKHSPSNPGEEPRSSYSNGPVDTGTEAAIIEIQDLMWKNVGIVRDKSGLDQALAHLEKLTPRIATPRTRRGYEALNLHTNGLWVARSALAREESRGAHYRTDFPNHDDALFLKHSVVEGNSIRFV